MSPDHSLLAPRLLRRHLRILLLLLQESQMGCLLRTLHTQLVRDFLDSHAFSVTHADYIVHCEYDVDGVFLYTF